MLAAANATEIVMAGLAMVMIGLGLGAALLVIRVILPGLADAADHAVARVRTPRMFMTGSGPLLGAALLGAGLERLGVQGGWPTWLFGVLVVLPLALALGVGALAAVPRLGGVLMGESGLSRDSGAPVLVRGLVGGGVLGLAGLTLHVPVLGLLVLLLTCSWLVATGIGICVGSGGPDEGANPGSDEPA